MSVNSIQTGLFRKLVQLGGGREGKCPGSLFGYISTISSAKSVILGCIKKEFHTLRYRYLNVVIKYYFGLKSEFLSVCIKSFCPDFVITSKKHLHRIEIVCAIFEGGPRQLSHSPHPISTTGDWFQKVNNFGALIDPMIKSKILSHLQSP